jgi:signal transduction histidine kinase
VQGAQLEVLAEESLAVIADSLRVTQAVGNMVDNALREGARHVELVATAAADGVELHVLDDGPGLPPAFIPQAFERFTRADSGRSSAGAGLGLAIVAAIAQAHGGAVGARNRENGGADVWLTLPAAKQRARPEATV